MKTCPHCSIRLPMSEFVKLSWKVPTKDSPYTCRSCRGLATAQRREHWWMFDWILFALLIASMLLLKRLHSMLLASFSLPFVFLAWDRIAFWTVSDLKKADPGVWMDREIGRTRPWARRFCFIALFWSIPTAFVGVMLLSDLLFKSPATDGSVAAVSSNYWFASARVTWTTICLELIWILLAIFFRLQEKAVPRRQRIFVPDDKGE